MPSPSSTRSGLATVPTDKRKQVAATLGLFAVLFIAVGAVAATGPGTVVIRTFVVVALVVAILLALMAWGVVHSIRLERADEAAQELDRRLDDAIAEVIAAQPRYEAPDGQRRYGSLCDCGQEHDPTEMHIVDAPVEAADPARATAAGPASAGYSDDDCIADGAGHDCTHSCATCLLGDRRTAPAVAAAAASGSRPATRPRPGPAPTPARRPSPNTSVASAD